MAPPSSVKGDDAPFVLSWYEIDTLSLRPELSSCFSELLILGPCALHPCEVVKLRALKRALERELASAQARELDTMSSPPQSSARPIPPVNPGSSLVAVPRRDSTGSTPSETSGPSLLLPGSAADAAPTAMPILTLSDDSLSPSLANAEGLASPADRSPREMLRRASLSANELVLTAVRTALERHPSFGRKLGIKLVPPQMGRSLSDGSTGRAPSSPRMEKTQAAAAAAAAAGARGPPLFSRGYWGSRACGRHTFYVVITLALLIIASQQFRLQRNFKKETIVVHRELRRKGGPWDALSNPAVRNALTAQARHGARTRMHACVCACVCMCVRACVRARATRGLAGRRAHYGYTHYGYPLWLHPLWLHPLWPCLLWRYSLWQGALIGVNFFLAFRGVQIWQLIQRVKVIQILHRVGWVAPLTQRGGRLLHATTLPVRGLVRGLTSPGRAVAATLAHRRKLDASPMRWQQRW